jgi:hypothetical protein
MKKYCLLLYPLLSIALGIAFLLGVRGAAVQAQTPAPKAPEPAKPIEFKFTQAQLWRLTAAQQEFYRWQDKVNDAARKFFEACLAAKEENHWPDVSCNIDSLTAAPKPKPDPHIGIEHDPNVHGFDPGPTPPTPPAAKEKSPPAAAPKK